MISYDDFAKLDIRVGEILSAERIPDTDKLLRLSVSFGEETRQIVSGIAQFVTPEELVGLRCPFVINLEPRMIRGFESQGMILATKTFDAFSLLSVTDTIPPGSKVN